jgi:hypothetical protein
MNTNSLEDSHVEMLKRFGEHLRDRKAVALVGSGVSTAAPSNLPSWPGLLELMAETTDPYSKHGAGLMRQLTAAGKLLEAADLFAVGDVVPKTVRKKFFYDLFATKAEQVPDLCREIAALEVLAWITTNYDNNLKYALASHNVDDYSNAKTELQNALSFLGQQKLLVHLHGRAANYDSLVYSSSTYAKTTKRAAYQQILRRLFAHHAVIAIGFSFTDPPFQDVLHYVSRELGGHTSYTHLAILPQTSIADKKLLSRAGFECILYDSTQGHDYVGRCIRELRRLVSKTLPKPRTTTPIPPPAHAPDAPTQEYSALVSAFLSITNPDRGSTYDTAAAALVATELDNGPLSHERLRIRIAKRVATNRHTSEELVSRGLDYLREEGRIRDGKEISIVSALGAPTGHSAPVVEAICTRMISLDKTIERNEGLERAIRNTVTHVMMAQGMAAARAFLNVDSPDWYAVNKVVDDATAASSVRGAWKRALGAALKEIIHEPTPAISRDLFKLANAAFALENVFLNPHGVDLGKALRWKVYLDSNVALRIFDPSGISGTGFRDFIDRLRRLRTPMFILGPFVEEMLGNVTLVGRQLSAAGATTVHLIERYAESLPVVERSPILNWFLWGLRTHRWSNFEQFVAREHLSDVASLSRRLGELDIVVEAHDAIPLYDTAERETLWAELREWRDRDGDSNRGRWLRRAEATQVLYLADLRSKGQKVWFISIDAQLRRALKYIRRGRYAGYVTTPGSWLLRLNMLHWGEVDVSGFAELMWAVPRQTPLERIRAMVMTRVLQNEPDLGQETPDWLRDRVETEFSKIGSVVQAAVASADADEEEKVVSDLAEQLVAPSAHRILDDIVRRRERK